MDDYVIRLVNANLGSAVAVQTPMAKQYTIAVFADGHIDDFALLTARLCVLISSKRRIALLDMEKREIIQRGRLSFQPRGIVIAPDGTNAVIYSENPAIVGLINLPALQERDIFNLAERRSDGGYDLVHRTSENLRKDGTSLQQIPFAEAPLRRLRFSKNVRPRLRSDGLLIAPFEYCRKGPEYIWDQTTPKPLASTLFDWTIGVAQLDLVNARVELRPFRRTMEHAGDSHFAIRSISPDAKHALLQSVSPIVSKPVRPKPAAGALAKVFGRREKPTWAHGLELWSLDGEIPIRQSTVAYDPFSDKALLHLNTARIEPEQVKQCLVQIDLVVPGVLAVLSGYQADWRESQEMKREEAFFTPLETTRSRPVRSPAFSKVDDPLFFGKIMRQMLGVLPTAPQTMPWSDMTNRQKWFLSHLLRGWNFHARTPVMGIAWTQEASRIVVIGRNGIVREVAFPEGPGPAWKVSDPPQSSHGFDWKSQDARLVRIRDRTFAVDYGAARLEFDLPASPNFGPHHLEGTKPLPIRVIMNHAQHAKELATADRLTRAIRPGYITIKSLVSGEIIAGVSKLAGEVSARFDEIVVDARWVPSLSLRSKPIEEQTFCDILVKDGSNAARQALTDLLDAYLEQTTGKALPVWHTDDTTPTMGPVALALIKLCDPIPQQVTAFVAQRDMEHDNWTPKSFGALQLSAKRFSESDLLALRIRLALQDISTGNVGTDLFSLYHLADEQGRLHKDPARAKPCANLIAAQIKAQWPDMPQNARAPGAKILTAITAAMNRRQPSEMALAAELLRLCPSPARP